VKIEVVLETKNSNIRHYQETRCDILKSNLAREITFRVHF